MTKILNPILTICIILVPIFIMSQSPNYSDKQILQDHKNGTVKSIQTYRYQQNGEINDSICYFNSENLKERNTYDTLGYLLLEEVIRKSKIDSTILRYDKKTKRTVETRSSFPKGSKIKFEHFYDNDFNIYFKWDSNNNLVQKTRFNELKKIIESYSYIRNSIKKYEYKYDSSGRIKEKKLSIDSDKYNKSIFSYDDANRPIEKQVYDKNQALSVIVKYEYLTKNNHITKFYDASNKLMNSMTKYRYYDEKNNLIKIIVYNPQGNYSGISEFKITYLETD